MKTEAEIRGMAASASLSVRVLKHRRTSDCTQQIMINISGILEWVLAEGPDSPLVNSLKTAFAVDQEIADLEGVI